MAGIPAAEAPAVEAEVVAPVVEEAVPAPAQEPEVSEETPESGAQEPEDEAPKLSDALLQAWELVKDDPEEAQAFIEKSGLQGLLAP